MQSERSKRRERESVEDAIFAFLGVTKMEVVPLVRFIEGATRYTCFLIHITLLKKKKI